VVAAGVLSVASVISTSIAPAIASTSGNTDYYEANDSISSPWWQGTSRPVTQRYGCTYLPAPKPEEPGPGWCPASQWQWHQGVDIGTSGVSIPLSSAVDGTVADWVYTTGLALTCQTLGYLALRTDGGNVIYLLHGSPTVGFATSPKAVHINDNVYTTGANGYLIPRISRGKHVAVVEWFGLQAPLRALCHIWFLTFTPTTAPTRLIHQGWPR
jgi:hypothetical protein